MFGKILKFFKIILLKRRSNKIYFVSSEQSGTHWVRNILADLYTAKFSLESKKDLFKREEIIPKIIESSCYEKEITIPRVQHVHWRYKNWMFKNEKVFLLTRDLRDAIVSQYEKYKKANKSDITFSIFLRQKNRPGLAAGATLFRRVALLNSWAKNMKKLDGFLVLNYEKIKKDTFHEMIRLASFCGLNTSDIADILNQAIEKNDFQKMKERERIHKEETGRKETVLNDGRSQKYKEYFSEEDKEFFQKYVRENLVDSFGYDYEVW